MTTKALDLLDNLSAVSAEDNFIVDTLAELVAFKIEQEIDLKIISKRSKISEDTLNKFMILDKTPTISEVFKIADALNLEIKPQIISKE